MVFQFFFEAALGIGLAVALAALVFLWGYNRFVVGGRRK